MKKQCISFFIFLIVLVSCFVSCDNSVFYDKSVNVDKKGWNVSKKLQFDVNITDTLKVYNFFINIRNTKDFPYQNVFFFINTTFPDGTAARDTLECLLSDAEGHWLGKTSGKLVDNRILFKPRVIFPISGTYTFGIEHGMREPNISGLSDIGLRITYANKNQ